MKIFNKTELKERRRTLRKNQTPAEKKLWDYLRNKQFLNLKFFRQYSIGYYITDFYCPKIKLVIELDGPQHFTEYSTDYDKVRTEIFESIGINVIRFRNSDVMGNIERVLDEIKKFVETHPDPPPKADKSLFIKRGNIRKARRNVTRSARSRKIVSKGDI